VSQVAMTPEIISSKLPAPSRVRHLICQREHADDHLKDALNSAVFQSSITKFFQRPPSDLFSRALRCCVGLASAKRFFKLSQFHANSCEIFHLGSVVRPIKHGSFQVFFEVSER
jgi:hypothetical protein